MSNLVLSEVFGPTIQGEGPSAGRRAVFVRLGLCNLDCKWCDTPYTWDWTGKNGEPQPRSALYRITSADLAATVKPMLTVNGVDRIVISGGEPLLQQRGLADFFAYVAGHALVEIETNGTINPTKPMFAHVQQWNVSPKLPHSGVDTAKAWRPDVLATLLDGARNLAVKVVCRTAADVELTATLVDSCEVPRRLVWIMPEGRTAVEVERGMVELADPAIDAGFNLTGRLHVLAWGDKRGV